MPERFIGIDISPKGIKDRDKEMEDMAKAKTKVKAKKEQEGEEQAEEQQEENPFAEYNNRTYQSYVKNNHADKIPHGVEAPNTRINDFISRVDLTKDHARKILTMVRLKTRDYVADSRKKIEKEFLVYHEEFEGRDWVGRLLRCGDNTEGVYRKVESTPEVKWNDRIGRSEVVGQNLAGTHQIHYIPFSKEKVDEIIAKSDSDKNEIIYVVKTPERRDHFNYDEFTNYTWEQCEKILLYDGGVQMARADRLFQSGKTGNDLNFKPS
jgi:hypothetical protein